MMRPSVPVLLRVAVTIIWDEVSQVQPSMVRWPPLSATVAPYARLVPVTGRLFPGRLWSSFPFANGATTVLKAFLGLAARQAT